MSSKTRDYVVEAITSAVRSVTAADVRLLAARDGVVVRDDEADSLLARTLFHLQWVD